MTFAHRTIVLTATLATVLSTPLSAQARIESNVVFGMYAGAGLLLDIYRPAQSKGLGVVMIPGGGWMVSPGPAGTPATQMPQVVQDASALASAGYTVFAVNHRGTPTFRYPVPVEDVQRAVRFVRQNAARFGVDSVRIAGMGGSSGGHLVGLLATMDGRGDGTDPDPINRQSAKLQCAVTVAAPFDLTRISPSAVAADALQALALFLGGPVREAMPSTYVVYQTAWAASPARYVTADDGPFLLIHGDVDNVVPFTQSVIMEETLKKAGVLVNLIRLAGEGHAATVRGVRKAPDYMPAIVSWLDSCLGPARPGQ